MTRALPSDPAALGACLEQLCEVAATAARAAGGIIAARAAAGSNHVTHKHGGGTSLAASVLTEVDRLAQQRIVELLAPSREQWGFGLLAEELCDDGSRLHAEAFWCVDPLDGTLPFIEGVAGYAVSIALVSRAGVPLLGVAYDPVEPRLYQAVHGGGAYRDGQRWRAVPSRPGAGPLSFFADRSFSQDRRFPAVTAGLERLSAQLGCSGLRVHVGAGAVINACSTLEHAPACYFKLPKGTPGGGSLWDYAASCCIASEYGASVSDSGGKPLDLNNPATVTLNHCGVCFASDHALAGELLGRLIPALVTAEVARD